MSLKLTVKFTLAEITNDSLTHRIRNFVEDLHRLTVRDGVGQVENMDTAEAAVIVRVDSQRKFSNVLAIARAMLKRHNFTRGVLLKH